MELQGKRVLVTGASRGIGRGLAEAFADEGAQVALVARSKADLEELATKLGGSAHPADLADADSVTGLIERVESEAGPIDVLVNNAGVSYVNYFLKQAPQEIESLFRINLLSPIHLCHQLIPRLLERNGGHIVNVSSMAGVMALPGLVHYGGSKAGLSHYTAGLRQDLRGLPITTTLVEIGSVKTELDDMSREYGPIKQVADRGGRAGGQMPVARVVKAIVSAVKSDRAHVRLPQPLGTMAMLVELPRRLSELAFRSVNPRG